MCVPCPVFGFSTKSITLKMHFFEQLIKHYFSLLVSQVMTPCLVIRVMPTSGINSLQLELACIMLKTSKTYPVG